MEVDGGAPEGVDHLLVQRQRRLQQLGPQLLNLQTRRCVGKRQLSAGW